MMLAPWKNSYDQPKQHVKEQRHCFAYKCSCSQKYGFSSHQVWILSIKKVEGQIIDIFKQRNWRRLLRVPQTARRANQSILKEISPEYMLKGLMLKLKLQYFGYPMGRADSLVKTPMILGKIEGRKRRA